MWWRSVRAEPQSTARQAGPSPRSPRGMTSQRIFDESVFLDDAAFDEMLLNDPVQNFRRDGVIPGAFRVHDRNRAVLAHAQAVGLRPENARLAFGEAELFQAFLQVFPRFKPFVTRGALRFRRIRTKKNMPPDIGDLEFVHSLGQLLLDFMFHRSI